MDNIKTWTGLPVEKSIRMTEDRDKWRKYVHGVATLGLRMDKEQNGRELTSLKQDGNTSRLGLFDCSLSDLNC